MIVAMVATMFNSNWFVKTVKADWDYNIRSVYLSPDFNPAEYGAGDKIPAVHFWNFGDYSATGFIAPDSDTASKKVFEEGVTYSLIVNVYVISEDKEFNNPTVSAMYFGSPISTEIHDLTSLTAVFSFTVHEHVGDVFCKTDAVCKICGKSCNSHELVYIDPRSATCTADGYEEAYFCSRCGKFFEDENCAVGYDTIEHFNIPKIGQHEFVRKSEITRGANEVAYQCKYCQSGSNVTWFTKLTDNIHYWYDDFYDVLYIYGTGEIKTSPTWNGVTSANVKRVIISEGITKIGVRAFFGMTALTDVTMPSTVTNIGAMAFMQCSSLTTIDLSNITTMDAMAFRETGLTSVILPKELKSVPGSAFMLCKNLKSVTVQGGYIAQNGFFELPDLEEVIIGADVNNIQVTAFPNINDLKIQFLGGKPAKFEDTAFEGSNVTIYIPNGEDSWSEDYIAKKTYGASSIEWVLYGEKTGAIVHGSISQAGEATDDVTIQLIKKGASDPSYQVTVSGTKTSYVLSSVAAGTYTMKVTKAGCATSEVEVVVGESDVTKDVVLHTISECPAIKGVSLDLSGQIGVNFKVIMPDWVAADQNSYVIMEYNGPTTPKMKVFFKDADKSVDATYGSIYAFSFPVALKEINDKVSLKLYDSYGNLIPLLDRDFTRLENDCYQYSVSDYISAGKATGREKLVNACTALENFGSVARVYFNYEKEGAVVPSFMITADMFKTYERQVSTEKTAGISFKTYSLNLESMTELKIKYELEAGRSIDDYVFTCDGEKMSPTIEETNGITRYVITKTGIGSRDLDTAYVFKVTGKDGKTETVISSAFSYGYSALSSYVGNASKKSLCDTMSAMYLYNKAAEEYFK